jgi:hypothetical protein
LRSIQRYCAKGHLDCLRQETTFGDKFMITPESVARHIAQIEELASANSRDLPRHHATDVAPQTKRDEQRQEQATMPDVSRPVATVGGEIRKREESSPDVTPTDHFKDRYIDRLEGENSFLRGQLTKKDEQIEDLSQRFKETQGLLGAVQRMLAPLLGQPDPFKSSRTGEGTARDVDTSQSAGN